MLGRVCGALVLAVLMAPVAFPVVDDATAGAPFTKQLRTFGFDGIKVTEAALQLSSTEDYDAYYFVVEADPVITLDGQPQEVVAGYVEVKRFGTNDIICRGQVAEVNEVHKHQICSDLRFGHPYIVTYILTTPAELLLYGHAP